MSGNYGPDSRYRQTGEVTRVDCTGRVLTVDELRRRQPTVGTFRHTVDANDRLDHLGQRYYGKPRKWWLIADANPEFTSPLTMLGHDAIHTIQLDVTQVPDPPGELHQPWSTILHALRARVGVEDVSFIADWADEPPDREPASGVLTIRFNENALTAVAVKDVVDGLLASAIRGERARVGAPRAVTRIGRQLIIPPDQSG